jgi:hypothetical protein
MEWKNKLAEYQAVPPPNAWNEIEKTLQQDGDSLYHHSVVPPNESWETISTKLSSLENNRPSMAINWLRPALRYAAMIAFLAIAITTLVNNSFRNALIESIQGPGIKAALTDTPYIIKIDTGKNKIQVKQIPR